MTKKPNIFFAEAGRAALVMAFATALGLAVNAASSRSLTFFSDPNRIDVTEFARLWNVADEPLLVVDVRGEAEFDSGHVPGALHASIETIQGAHSEIAPMLQAAAVIVVMCESNECGKADNAAEVLRKFGYKTVRVLDGGWEAYKREGFAIEEAHK